MTDYDDFIKTINLNLSKMRRDIDIYIGNSEYKDIITNEETLSEHIETGGYSGGSCWGGEAEKYTADPQDFQLLEELLGIVYPSISFLDFRSLQKNSNIVSFDEKSIGEYYGNCTDYKVITINLKNLYSYIVDKQ